MTYSIVARDPDSGEMGLATHSQAFAVGSSVPWGEPGFGVIATQSIAEPYYGQLGLDLLRGGMTATESLEALRSVDPHPERRQVAMVDGSGEIAAYTGDGCIAAAGHLVGDTCCALANMAASPAVWERMVSVFEESSGDLARRLVAALVAAEEEGGDIRGCRSAAVMVVRSVRTGRPWRDHLVDLRVDDHELAVPSLRRLVEESATYHQVVRGFEHAIDGDPARGLAELEQLDPDDLTNPDLVMWRGVVLSLAGRHDEATATFARLAGDAPRFIEAARRMAPAGLLPDPDMVMRALDEATGSAGDAGGPERLPER
jgi:uncharacterized Ntn-hydrolase superfamily protein